MSRQTEIILHLLPLVPLIVGFLIIVIRQYRHQKWQDKHDKMMSDINRRRCEMEEEMFRQKYGHGIDELDKY